jgi:hypothetical protein
MRLFTKPLAAPFVLLLILSSATATHAQFDTADNGTVLPNAYGVGNNAAAIDQVSQVSSTVVATPNDPAAAGTPSSFPGSPDDSPQFAKVMQWIMTLFAWLVGVAAITLDNAVYYTIVKMGTFVSHLSAIGVTWRILRDFGNIMLIFGFVAVGVTTILNVDWYGGGKKMLPMMLVAAVFLNFSLFIAEAFIDTSNLFATQFYTQINGGQPAGSKSFTTSDINNDGISNKIMAQLGLQTIYGDSQRNTKIFESGNSWIIGFMGIILFIVTSFVLFSLAFVLIARFVALIFLIILAPVGFAGLAVPMLKRRADKWWSTLFEQIVTAPILMLMLYVALAIITDAQFLTGFGLQGATAATGFVDNQNLVGFASFILSFLVAMGVLLAVVIQSKNLSAFGAGWATKTAGKLTFGATAWAGRTTLGWGANRTAKYLRTTGFSRVPIFGTNVVKGLEGVAGSSFDVRGTGALKNFPGGEIDAGTAQKGGYKADLKARVESRTKYAEDLKGRELTSDEKRDLAVLQNQLAGLERERAEATTAADYALKDAAVKAKEKEIETAEAPGDKGAKRKYARALNLWTDDKNAFNKYFNFAANTEAAKKIRDEAKKGSGDAELNSLRAALRRASGQQGGPGGAGGGAAGGAGAGGATPGGAGPGGPGAQPPPAGFQQGPGGIFTPNSSGGGPRRTP